MTLSTSKVGNTYRVTAVRSEQKLQNFLKTLGLIEGGEVTLITKTGTNYILNLKDSRYAVDKALASKIEVEAI